MTTTPRVALVGTLDTKGAEYHWMADRLSDLGVDVVVVDTGIRAPSAFTDDVSVGRDRVAQAAGTDIDTLVDGNDRGAAVTAMGEGAAVVLADLTRHAASSTASWPLGGSGGSSIAARAVRDLPIGLPKLIVSTMASGDVSPYVGAADVTHDVLRRRHRRHQPALPRRCSATPRPRSRAWPGSMRRRRGGPPPTSARWSARRCSASPRRRSTRPARASTSWATRCSSSTPPAPAAGRWRRWRGPGCWPASSTSPPPNWPTTSSAACSARVPTGSPPPARTGVPQVVSLGALDMVNFGPRDTVPESFAGRHVLRAQPDRDADAHHARGERRARPPDRHEARRRDRADRPLRPARTGSRLLDAAGQAFHDPAADDALFDAVAAAVDGSDVTVIDDDANINDPELAAARWPTAARPHRRHAQEG